MDAVQLQHERAVGDQLIEWLNNRDGTSYTFLRREGEAPDLVYADRGRLLRVEVVGAYYDSDHARLLWGHAREVPDTPNSWSGVDFDEALLRDIERQIHKKCKLSYGPNCVLLVTVRPPMTVWEEVEELLYLLKLPERIPFDGVFLAGTFPMSTRSTGGYRVWVFKDITG
jgi:hypothetical protein